MKQKHINVIEQTIIRRVEFDTHDLAGAAVIQEQLVNTAKPMVGFVSQSTRMTKVPAVEKAAPADTAKDPLDIPTAMKRA